MGAMGEMMRGVHSPAVKELYPSLMALPDLPLEKRAEVARRARERMTQGLEGMSAAIADHAATRPRGDGAARRKRPSACGKGSGASRAASRRIARSREEMPRGTPLYDGSNAR